MKTKLLCELKRSVLLFLWLLLGQLAVSVLLTVASILALALGAFGVIPLVGHGPLWVWIAVGVPVCLFWLAMGRFAPQAIRPGSVGAAAVLAVWAVLASLLRTMYTMYPLFLPQEFCGGMLEQILRLWGCGAWADKGLGVTIACFLLPAVVGMGLYLGWKRTTEAGYDGER